MTSPRRLRALIVAASVLLGTGVWAVTQSASAAAQAQNNFTVNGGITEQVGGVQLKYDLFNRGPDGAVFEVIAWYSEIIEFPGTLSVDDSGDCDLLVYEDRGSGTVGVCTKHGPHHSTLPVGHLHITDISFSGEFTLCDRINVRLRLDGALRDPSPVNQSYGLGISGGC